MEADVDEPRDKSSSSSCAKKSITGFAGAEDRLKPPLPMLVFLLVAESPKSSSLSSARMKKVRAPNLVLTVLLRAADDADEDDGARESEFPRTVPVWFEEAASLASLPPSLSSPRNKQKRSQSAWRFISTSMRLVTAPQNTSSTRRWSGVEEKCTRKGERKRVVRGRRFRSSGLLSPVHALRRIFSPLASFCEEYILRFDVTRWGSQELHSFRPAFLFFFFFFFFW